MLAIELLQLKASGKKTHTAVDVLVDLGLDLALVGHGHGLLGDGAAAVVEALGLLHGAFESVALPAEQVVGVGAEAAVTLEAPHERLLLARSPQAVERGRVPDGLVCYLGYTDGVGGWARRSVNEAVLPDGVEHVILVVGAVEVLAVPAPKARLGSVSKRSFLRVRDGGY